MCVRERERERERANAFHAVYWEEREGERRRMWQNHVTCERKSEITKGLVERGRKSGGGIQAHKQKQIQTHTLKEREIERVTQRMILVLPIKREEERNTKKDFTN